MGKRTLLDGIGYIWFGTRLVDWHGELRKRRGWWLAKTPDGKPGSTFEPKFLGRDKREARINTLNDEVFNFLCK